METDHVNGGKACFLLKNLFLLLSFLYKKIQDAYQISLLVTADSIKFNSVSSTFTKCSHCFTSELHSAQKMASKDIQV